MPDGCGRKEKKGVGSVLLLLLLLLLLDVGSGRRLLARKVARHELFFIAGRDSK